MLVHFNYTISWYKPWSSYVYVLNTSYFSQIVTSKMSNNSNFSNNYQTISIVDFNVGHFQSWEGVALWEVVKN